MTDRPRSLLESRIQALVDRADFDGAEAVLSKLAESRPLTIRELVMRGRIIQLGSGKTHDLDDAERCFEQALSADQEYVPALLELGWFHHAVKDEPRRALEFFDRALAILERFSREAEKGREECLSELASE